MPKAKYLNMRVSQEDHGRLKEAAAKAKESLTVFLTLAGLERAEQMAGGEGSTGLISVPVVTPVPASPEPEPSPKKGWWENRQPAESEELVETSDGEQTDDALQDNDEVLQDEQGYWYRLKENGKRDYDIVYLDR
jgi:hypothetical protein